MSNRPGLDHLPGPPPASGPSSGTSGYHWLLLPLAPRHRIDAVVAAACLSPRARASIG